MFMREKRRKARHSFPFNRHLILSLDSLLFSFQIMMFYIIVDHSFLLLGYLIANSNLDLNNNLDKKSERMKILFRIFLLGQWRFFKVKLVGACKNFIFDLFWCGNTWNKLHHLLRKTKPPKYFKYVTDELT